MVDNDHTRTVEGDYQGIYAEVANATNGIRQRILTVMGVNKNIAVRITSYNVCYTKLLRQPLAKGGTPARAPGRAPGGPGAPRRPSVC